MANSNTNKELLRSYTFSVKHKELENLSSLFIRIQTTRPKALKGFLSTNTERLKLPKGVLLQDILKYIEHKKYLEELILEEEKLQENPDANFLNEFLDKLTQPHTPKKSKYPQRITLKWK